MIFLITEKSIPENISNAQIEGNLNTIKTITKNLNLTGNAIFLPKTNNRTEERVFIPLNNKNKDIPDIDDSRVFYTGIDGKSLGISIPPSGLKILKEVEKELTFEDFDLDNIEEALKIFIGIDLIKSVNIKKTQEYYVLEIQKPINQTMDSGLNNQYPGPIYSAILTAISRAAKQKITINKTEFDGKKIFFYLKIGD